MEIIDNIHKTLKEDLVVVQRQLYRDKADSTAPQESVSNIQVRLGEYDQNFTKELDTTPAFVYHIIKQISKGDPICHFCISWKASDILFLTFFFH